MAHVEWKELAEVALKRIRAAGAEYGDIRILDSRTQVELMDVFQKLNEERGMTIVLVTHEQDVSEHAKRVLQFGDGKIRKDYLVKSRRTAAEELKHLPVLDEDEDDEEEDQ